MKVMQVTAGLNKDIDQDSEFLENTRKAHNCYICDSNFSNKALLLRHMKTVHEGKRPFQCDLCDTSYSRIETLTKHISKIGTSQGDRCFILRPKLHQSLDFPLLYCKIRLLGKNQFINFLK